MPDEDQERFEDYVDLANYIEALQAGKVAHPPTNITPEQARIYQMAALFRAGTNDNAEPDPEFVERLKDQLLEAKEQPPVIQSKTVTMPDEELTLPLSIAPEKAPVPMKDISKGISKRARFFSRRGLLTGGAIAAASLVVGAGVGYEEQKSENPKLADKPDPSYPPASSQHLTISTPTTWYFVTTLADLGNEAVRFTSDTIVGYVLRTPNTAKTVATATTTDTSKSTDSVIALSAACTHMGCLVQWKNNERNFTCPCHGALFGTQGAQIATNYRYTLPPLPSLNTKIEDGNVYVEVPR